MLQRIKMIQGIQNQGRLVQPDNLHLTVHFLGNIDIERIDCFVQQAKSIKLKPFELHLNKVGYFKRPKVLWLGCEVIPDRLLQLHKDLAISLNNCAYIPESRKYHPHVTVARKINEPVIDHPLELIKWSVDDFVLVKSVTHVSGVEYQVRGRFGK
jgi:RNA 2',3'-cyclic 3'-phosphodiesterase